MAKKDTPDTKIENIENQAQKEPKTKQTEENLPAKKEDTSVQAKGGGKKQKTVPMKKLPPVFRKKYTRAGFERKILKKLYIEADKKLVEKMFVAKENEIELEILSVPKDYMVPKADFARYKIIAAELKKQKSTIKFLPLIAVLVLICGIGITVLIFKNFVVEKLLTASMQDIFNAKTDIANVDVQIFGSQVKIEGLQQANRDAPMKNLFQIDKINVDFDLTDLLRGKFHAQNIEVSGVAIDTDRTESGELPHSTDSKEEKSVIDTLKDTSASLADTAAEKLKEMFADYNPETMLSNLQNELQSPAVANTIASDVQEKVKKWQAVPEEYQKSITKLSSDVDTLIKTNWGKITNTDTLKKTLVTIDSALTESNALKSKVDKTAKEIKTDSESVTKYASQLQTAMKADTNLVETKIADMKSTFSPDGLKSIMTQAAESIIYEKTGQFYPYVNKAMNAALSAKNEADSKTPEQKAAEAEAKAKKAEKKAAAAQAKKDKQIIGPARSQGRTVYYKADTIPKLLIENVKASGYEYKTNDLLFEGIATEISSDQNMRGKPATVKADFKVLGKANSADVVVDARKNSAAKLVTASYSGKGWPISANAQIFDLSSASDITARLVADKDGTCKISGNLDMAVTRMTGMEFEPQRVSALYSNALAGISKLTMGFTIGYDAKSGIVVSLDDVDKLASQLVQPVTKAIQGELNVIAQDAQSKVTAVLSEKTGIAQESISQFTDIQGLVNGQVNSVNDIQKQLEAKKKEVNQQITKAAKNAAADAIKKLF